MSTLPNEEIYEPAIRPYIRQPELRKLPKHLWIHLTDDMSEQIDAWWLSNLIGVQVYKKDERKGVRRLTIHSIFPNEQGGWDELAGWDLLQHAKNSVGFGERHAVEIFPSTVDLVNVSNMRHLWVLDEPLPFAWQPSRGIIWTGEPN